MCPQNIMANFILKEEILEDFASSPFNAFVKIIRIVKYTNCLALELVELWQKYKHFKILWIR